MLYINVYHILLVIYVLFCILVDIGDYIDGKRESSISIQWNSICKMIQNETEHKIVIKVINGDDIEICNINDINQDLQIEMILKQKDKAEYEELIKKFKKNCNDVDIEQEPNDKENIPSNEQNQNRKVRKRGRSSIATLAKRDNNIQDNIEQPIICTPKMSDQATYQSLKTDKQSNDSLRIPEKSKPTNSNSNIPVKGMKIKYKYSLYAISLHCLF